MLAEQIDVALRHELLERLADARVRTDEIFSLVRPDNLYDRPIAERHRIIFYVGHLEAFDWNLLRDRLFTAPATQPEYDRLFAFGIDPVDGGLPSDQPKDWPSISEVHDYVAQTRRVVDHGIERCLSGENHPSAREFPATQLLQVAIEHRLMHAETLAYMLHQLPLDRKIRPSQNPELLANPVKPMMVKIPEGKVTLGLRRGDEQFGWDNEFEQFQAHVPAFEIDKYMVSNGQFLEFLQAGGYDNQQLWDPSDWKWKSEHAIERPGFWRSKGGGWYLRTMFDEIPFPAIGRFM